MGNSGVATPPQTAEQEAISLLQEIIASLLSAERDIVLLLRKCLHVCNLLKWDGQWFHAELYGYAPSQTVPWYRHVRGKRSWRANAPYDILRSVVEDYMHGAEAESSEDQEIRGGMIDLVAQIDKGYYIPTGKTSNRLLQSERHEISGQEVIDIGAAQLKAMLSKLETDVFRWASSSYPTIAFGAVVGDIWHSYRAIVDGKLSELGLTDVLRQISSGLVSAEPQAWRQAMYSCRDLLHDFAAHLWKDPRPTYSHLTNDDGNPIAVTEDKYMNRLMAYQHQKGAAGTSGEYFRANWRRLSKLNAFASTAHNADAMTLQEARSVAIAVYVALGELIDRTDMQPIEHYD